MAVTRLKRKDRKNKTVSRLTEQGKKQGTNLEIGSKAVRTNGDKQMAKNNEAIAIAKKAIK